MKRKLFIGLMIVFAAIGAKTVTVGTDTQGETFDFQTLQSYYDSIVFDLSNQDHVDNMLQNDLQNQEEIDADVLNAKFAALNLRIKKLDCINQGGLYDPAGDQCNIPFLTVNANLYPRYASSRNLITLTSAVPPLTSADFEMLGTAYHIVSVDKLNFSTEFNYQEDTSGGENVKGIKSIYMSNEGYCGAIMYESDGGAFTFLYIKNADDNFIQVQGDCLQAAKDLYKNDNVSSDTYNGGTYYYVPSI